ncbi:SH3 domain-containing protein [Streptomyces gilvosporeus]|uniref:SH3b domain-containing protein n=1 Tax=Streptomyces gilvosporeus TaxID=553510 RepID=A0A1V0TL64_9ACTN|nr:SH3 domain-containing protein [Streptomyces gilvosporeus]ARF53643.1 hypothetical protein B1H19_05120 [Streptomyces gilvosporeus]
MIFRTMRHAVVAAVATVALLPASAVAVGNPSQPPTRHAARVHHARHVRHVRHIRHTTMSHSAIGGTRGRVVTRIAPLNVRSGPGIGFTVIGSLHRGAVVYAAYKKHGTWICGNRHWYKLAGRTGYVSARYVRVVSAVPEQ